MKFWGFVAIHRTTLKQARAEMKYANTVLAILALFIPMLYIGAYLALSDVAGRWGDFVAIGDDVYSERLPTYRGGDDFSSDFFWPIHQADRCLRPQVWYEPTR